ncbi:MULTISPECIES: DNA polymerase III subunit epsilon [Methylocaldum]|jgi:DNA polymerase-3 subunit epsilon|uniref:DNA polymerase III subunit epsilon n=1 Tax=unclassified Methylocaldum TaxID=2622260 RepID=UPI00098A4CE1|nr:DNA polymerase III subunit epsilon [Methylocaldum sp. 14B]MDV3240384.1 DNA polymerase III subunit epsilon [Methylocaldum sp.]MVF20501.1 DNA polymerase III subunit epsilon [Methylocaldum sp. BRCS4]
MRQVVLDTETTGLDPAEGHRIIEIGCVELISRRLTGNRFHVYLNPERNIDPGAVEVHGLSAEFLADKPRFADIAEDLLAYIKGAELVIHNAPFDVGFLNHELQLLSSGFASVAEYCTVLDTLVLAKKKHPGQRNNLDALCKRYGVDNRHRELHGALLDAEILAEVYLAMTGGQTLLVLEPESTDEGTDKLQQTPKLTLSINRPQLKIIRCSETELQAHAARLDAIDKASNGKCLWKA